MITAPQLRAARALLGIDQKTLAEISNVPLPTIQRMEASDENVRGNIDTLSKVVTALGTAGVELIGEHSRSEGDGRGVRLRQAPLHFDLKRFHPMKLKESQAAQPCGQSAAAVTFR
jgi:transcriptional regulator with XRE-family HTH domain